MTVVIQPEDEKLIEEKRRSGAFRSLDELIHRALISLPVEESAMPEPIQNLAQFLWESPLARAELDLERRRHFIRRIEL